MPWVWPPLGGDSRSFQADASTEKRAKMIDRVIEKDGWADNWVGYWQDALAENPNLLKPNLNNTGPFRYWILDALRDNKSMDRFATELDRDARKQVGREAPPVSGKHPKTTQGLWQPKYTSSARLFSESI